MRRETFTLLTISSALVCGMLYPAQTQAGVLDEIRGFWQTKAEASSLQGTSVQAMALPKPAMNIDPNPEKGGGDVTIVDGEALLPEEGPSGTMADIEKTKNQQISIYVVREGDTLTGIAKMFGVSANTIKWANDIPPSGTIRIGQTLTVLPISGLKYKVQKGDTFASIAKKHEADAQEIANYNGIEELAVGAEILIPNGEVTTPAVKTVAKSTTAGKTSTVSRGYFIAPLANYRRTQPLHGYQNNSVDLASTDSKTAPILASADGDVIVARSNGLYNGGYGNYVVIQHSNGTQTLYAHASGVIVGVGQRVVQGEVIGYQGATGKVTGAHVHFEIRGPNAPINPF